MQPIGAFIFLVFTMVAGAASIYSAWFGQRSTGTWQQVRLDHVYVRQFSLGRPVVVELVLRNDGPDSIHLADIPYKVVLHARFLAGQPISVESDSEEQESLWSEFLAPGMGNKAPGITILSGAKEACTLTGAPLTREWLDRINNGKAVVFFGARFVWTDQAAVHESDVCGFAFGSPIRVSMCKGHNIP